MMHIRFYRFFSVIVFLLLLLGSTVSRADDARDYYISGYRVDARIQKDGSIAIHEDITYTFNGHFNGVLRDIAVSPADGISLNRVGVMKDSGEIHEFVQDAGSYDSDSGTRGTYRKDSDGSKLRLWLDGASERRQ